MAQQSTNTVRYIPLLHILLRDGSIAWAAILRKLSIELFLSKELNMCIFLVVAFAIIIPYITILRVDIHIVFAWVPFRPAL